MVRYFAYLAFTLCAAFLFTLAAVGAAPSGDQPGDGQTKPDVRARPLTPTRVAAQTQQEIATRFRQLGLTTDVPPEQPDGAATSASSATHLTQNPAIVRAGIGEPVSIQVNVNNLGLDIVGDAANEPTMAVDPNNPNRIVIAWRQFDTVENSFRQAGYAYSTNRGASWTAGLIDPGVFRSDPVLDVDATGDFYFSGLTNLNNEFSVAVFKSTDGGQTWGAGVNAFGGDKQWMVVDRTGGMGDGHIYQHWNADFSCCPPNDFTRSTDAGASFQGPYTIPPPEMMWGTNAVDPEGTFFACGAFPNTFRGHVVARSKNAQNAAQAPIFDLVTGVDLGGFSGGGVVNPAGLLGQVWIAADHSNTSSRGYLYMLGSVFNPFSFNPLDVHIVRSVDGGESWSPFVRVNDDPTTGAWHWFGAISVAPNGRIDVTWYDTRDDIFNPFDPIFSRVYYAYSLDQGRTWSASTPISPSFNHFLGYPQQNKLGDYTQMISDNGGANLAYAATFNLSQDVYFVRIPFDCNNNGVEDPLDVAGGDSDCNHNDIPDGCEAFSDCNFNKTNDICDIGAGTSPDCDANSVPDECESLEDCNVNGQVDICDLASGDSKDCNANHIPDECDILSGRSLDRNHNGIPDDCQTACCLCTTACVDANFIDCVQMGGFPAGLGTVCFDTICPPPPGNDFCDAAQALPPFFSISVPIDNNCAFTDFSYFIVECDAGFQPFGTDLWYSYEPPCDGPLTVSLCDNTNFDTILAVYDGGADCACPANDETLVACGDDTCGVGGGPSAVTFDATASTCYLIRVGGWNGSVGFGALEISLVSTPGGPGAASGQPPVAGDCNHDDALTPADQAGFAECMSGPAVSRSLCCECADVVSNNRVDLRDFAAIQNAYVVPPP